MKRAGDHKAQQDHPRSAANALCFALLTAVNVFPFLPFPTPHCTFTVFPFLAARIVFVLRA